MFVRTQCRNKLFSLLRIIFLGCGRYIRVYDFSLYIQNRNHGRNCGGRAAALQGISVCLQVWNDAGVDMCGCELEANAKEEDSKDIMPNHKCTKCHIPHVWDGKKILKLGGNTPPCYAHITGSCKRSKCQFEHLPKEVCGAILAECAARLSGGSEGD